MADVDLDKPMTRIEAAAYLVTKGLTMRASTLAKYASDGRGPRFSKSTDGNHTLYDKTDLDLWVASGGNKRSGNKGGRPRKDSARNDLLAALEEFLPLVERIALNKGTFADGVMFERSLERIKASMRSRRNGAH